MLPVGSLWLSDAAVVPRSWELLRASPWGAHTDRHAPALM